MQNIKKSHKENKEDESEKVEGTNRGRNLKVGNRPGDRLPHPKIVEGTASPISGVLRPWLQVHLNNQRNIKGNWNRPLGVKKARRRRKFFYRIYHSRIQIIK